MGHILYGHTWTRGLSGTTKSVIIKRLGPLVSSSGATQCSNYYRSLIEKGEVVDPNYYLDEKGKAHYLFSTTKRDGSVSKGVRTHKKKAGLADGESGDTAESSPSASTSSRRTMSSSGPKAKPKRRRKQTYGDSDEEVYEGFDDDDSGTFSCNWATTKRSRSRRAVSQHGAGMYAEDGDTILEEDEDADEEAIDTSNPLPGFVDPITLEEVIKPAISPYGHVMSYDSWVRCLTTGDKRNVCPLTKKPLAKRELVVLTRDNIEEYRSRIVNMS
jgi:hypothetical protein